MKRNAAFLVFLGGLSLLGGWLLSHITLIGRVGIDLMHKEYRFLKVWWKGAALLFIIWGVLFAIQNRIQKRMSPRRSQMLHILFLLAAAGGLYFTWSDFRHDFSHRLLGERFHLGAYLYWLGWMSISIFFLSTKTDNTAAVRQPQL